MTKSQQVSAKLGNVLAVFRNAVNALNSLASETQEAITEQENIIAQAQTEKETLQATLAQIGGVKDNLTNLLEPAT